MKDPNKRLRVAELTGGRIGPETVELNIFPNGKLMLLDKGWGIMNSVGDIVAESESFDTISALRDKITELERVVKYLEAEGAAFERKAAEFKIMIDEFRGAINGVSDPRQLSLPFPG